MGASPRMNFGGVSKSPDQELACICSAGIAPAARALACGPAGSVCPVADAVITRIIAEERRVRIDLTNQAQPLSTLGLRLFIVEGVTTKCWVGCSALVRRRFRAEAGGGRCC